MNSKRLLKLFLSLFLLIHSNVLAQNKIKSYEYWFDDNYNSNIQTLLVPDSEINIISTISVLALTPGLHTFNFRFKDDSSKYSAVTSKYFLNLRGNINSYEYWYDNDYINKITQAISPSQTLNVLQSLNINNLQVGLHKFNFRSKNQSELWSSLESMYFLKLSSIPNGSGIAGYRYWFDSNDSLLTNIDFGFSSQSFMLLNNKNMSNLSFGYHTINYQFKNGDNIWSTVAIDTFYNVGKPALYSITPKEGGNAGDVTVNIYGNGFFDSTTVMLVRAGIDTVFVPDSLMAIIEGNRIVANLDLRGKIIGLYDLVVEVPEKDTVMVLQNSFEIKQAHRLDPIINIVGPTSVRAGQWNTYSITLTNNGNVDEKGIPLFIAVDSIAQLQFLSNFLNYNVADSTFFLSDTLYTTGSMDTLFGKPFHGKVYAIIVSNISALNSITINLKIKAPTAFKIRCWTNKHLYASPLNNEWAKCIDDIITTVVGTFPVAGCVYGLLRACIDPVILYNNQANGVISNYSGSFNTSGVNGLLTDYAWGLGTSMLGCALGVNGFVIRKSLNEILDLTEALDHGVSMGGSCEAAVSRINNNSSQINITTSKDPNEKYGPIGNGIHNYLQEGTVIPYVIHFENQDTATAAAQTVLILDTLDKNIFNLSTFQLKSITIADTIILIPPGYNWYESFIDLRPKSNVIVHVIDSLNKTNGVAFWSFKALDPATYEPLTDSLSGFLPPNIIRPEGEGSIFYTIKLKDSIPNNSQVRNKASIYFDYNSPVITNTWINTIDNIKPQSKVVALPSIQYNDSIFTVQWNGIDTSSGILSYDIYYSTNGGSYLRWLANTIDSTANFYGHIDSTYSFYSIATDTAGNIEDAPFLADATTLLLNQPNQVTNNKNASNLIQVFPNPNNGDFNVIILNPKVSQCKYKLYNSFGIAVRSGMLELSSSNSSKLSFPELNSGNYLFKVSTETQSWSKKIEILKH